jgi:hypothetical protein
MSREIDSKNLQQPTSRVVQRDTFLQGIRNRAVLQISETKVCHWTSYIPVKPVAPQSTISRSRAIVRCRQFRCRASPVVTCISCGGTQTRMGLALVGGVGVILFSAFLSMSIYQTAIYLGDSNSTRHGKQYLLKVCFHVVFGLYCLFDLLYYTSLYFYGRYTIWGYDLHLVALLLNLYSFSLVIYLWRVTLDPRDIRMREKVSAFIFLSINTLSTAYDLALWSKLTSACVLLPSSLFRYGPWKIDEGSGHCHDHSCACRLDITCDVLPHCSGPAAEAPPSVLLT